ncbi:type I secretion system permease/ATPase [Roseovarius sp. 2305UL8-3]|uniref:type I secretion system permease/ATPase n=1 Tax=Roseovarius conchicola TaxID=3121636 RepID=UPI003527F703
MDKKQYKTGLDELRAVRKESRALYWFVGVFSFFVNLLMLTGPLYMLQVYDRVLGSGSVETLIALSALVAFLFAMMGILDYARGRVMSKVAGRFQSRLDGRVFDAVIRKTALGPDPAANTGLRDLEAVQRLLSSPVLTAMFDLPWTPVFIIAIWIFHPWLGALAIVGGLLLIMVTVFNQIVTRRPVERMNHATATAEEVLTQLRTESEMVRAMGMSNAAHKRWYKARGAALGEQIGASDMGGTFTTITRTFRLFLQSAMLGVGAYLVLLDELTPGAMIAGSILLGRALAPIEQVIGQWSFVQRAMQAWENLALLLGRVPPVKPKTKLPRPKALLEVQQLVVAPPGEQQAALKGISFTVQPGQAVGVIGASGAGKSTLARALTGVWPPAGGKIRLDGAALDQFENDVLGQHVGYLPQRVQLFDGTISENIARLADKPDDEQVVTAARRADAHEMILRLPDGYDTRVTAGGGRLSGGQMQRIGLARAMYGDPVILVLDEPNSNLDNEGSEAVNAAIRGFKSAGKSILIMAHRPAAIKECDLLLVLEQGSVRAFGPRDKVLREVLANHQEVSDPKGPGGVQ